MTRDEIVMLAVALGQDKAAVIARLDAAYPPVPAPKKTDVVGFARTVHADGTIEEHELMGDGSRRPKARE